MAQRRRWARNGSPSQPKIDIGCCCDATLPPARRGARRNAFPCSKALPARAIFRSHHLFIVTAFVWIGWWIWVSSGVIWTIVPQARATGGLDARAGRWTGMANDRSQRSGGARISNMQSEDWACFRNSTLTTALSKFRSSWRKRFPVYTSGICRICNGLSTPPEHICA